MIVIGLTGSIAMGKSTTAEMFRKLGVPVFDSDAVVHALYAPGGAAVGPVLAAFPGTGREGGIDRAALAHRLTDDKTGFERLEAIVHPLVRQEAERFLARCRAAGEAMAVLDIPLLFETGRDKDVDMVVVVSAPPEVQRRRVMERPGMTEEKFAQILARQLPDAEKRARADFVVDSGQGFDAAFAQVRRIVDRVKLEAKPHA